MAGKPLVLGSVSKSFLQLGHRAGSLGIAYRAVIGSNDISHRHRAVVGGNRTAQNIVGG